MRAMLVLLVGCNSVYDIGGTLLEDPPTSDVDGDGVIDRDDNCPTLANDQTDVDSDGIGDTCDGCPSGELTDPADEDGDGVVDTVTTALASRTEASSIPTRTRSVTCAICCRRSRSACTSMGSRRPVVRGSIRGPRLVTAAGVTGYNRVADGAVDAGNLRFIMPTITLRASISQATPTAGARLLCGWDSIIYPFPTATQADLFEVEVSLVAETRGAIHYVDLVR